MNEAMLKVYTRVIRAENLAKKDTFGLSDPYVKVALITGNVVQDEYRTNTVKKSLNPKWNYPSHEFCMKSSSSTVSRSKLLFEVFDANRVTRDDFLGQVEIAIGSLPIVDRAAGQHPEEKAYLLRPRTAKSRVRGHLYLVVSKSPIATGDTHSSSESLSGAAGPWEMVRDTDSPSQPLPPGWEERTDDVGRLFYVDHTNQRTQWERPTNTGSTRLPPNWEERIDGNGRTFYVNHLRHITQWEVPSDESTNEEETQATAQATAQEIFLNSRHQLSVEDVQPRSGSVSSSHLDELISSARDSGDGSHRHANNEALPAGWSVSYTESGRPFFIDHSNRTTTWDDPRQLARRNSTSRSGSISVPSMSAGELQSDRLGALPAGWEERVHSDGRTFFINHNTRSTQWEDPRLAKLGGPAVPYSRDYQQKYTFFRSSLRKPDGLPNKVDIKVKRKDLLETSFNAVMVHKNADILKTRLWVEFDSEKGLDYGGISREWFYLLSKEMFNPYYGLFENSAVDNYTLQVNPLSGQANPNHLQYFQFIGRVAGTAVFHGKLLDGFFIRPFYKMMLDKPMTLNDMESVDSEYHNSLKWIIENSIDDLDGMDMDFSVEEDIFGVTEQKDLKPGGRNIKVNDGNKKEYVHLIIQWRFCNRIKEQMDAFRKGFHELVPHNAIQIFDENELEMLICGIQDIDVNDWKQNTNYKGDYDANHPTIVHFWKVVFLMSNEARARLLQFVTGTSRVPMNGFRHLYGSNGPQKFTIECWGTVNQYPRAHTCFNRIDLPPYNTFELVRERINAAVELSQGFEGVD